MLLQVRLHFARMAEQYESVKSSSLMQRCDVLRAAIDELAGDTPAARIAGSRQLAMTTGSVSSNVSLLADQLQASRGRTFEERAATALRVLAASARAGHGALGFLGPDESLRIVATLDGKAVSPDLIAWMSQRLDREQNDPDTIVSGGPAAQPLSVSFRENVMTYSLTLLSQVGATGPVLLGVAALGGEHGAPSVCSRELVRLVCQLLGETPSGSEQI